MRLPYLTEKDQWPTAKDPEERVANPSHDTQLENHLVEEILSCAEKRDSRGLREAIQALVEMIRGQDEM